MNASADLYKYLEEKRATAEIVRNGTVAQQNTWPQMTSASIVNIAKTNRKKDARSRLKVIMFIVQKIKKF